MSIEIPKTVGPRERALRVRHAAELAEHSRNQPAEIARHLSGKSAKIRQSMPVRQYIEKRRKLTLASHNAGSALDWSDGRPVSVASGYRSAITALDQAHEYPAGLVAEVERRLLSGSPCQHSDEMFRSAVEEAASQDA